MAYRKITEGEDFGSSLKEFSDRDLERGYADATPKGNYEGALDPSVVYEFEDGDFVRVEGGTLQPGNIEPDGINKHSNGGFLRRPFNRTDVERS